MPRIYMIAQTFLMGAIAALLVVVYMTSPTAERREQPAAATVTVPEQKSPDRLMSNGGDSSLAPYAGPSMWLMPQEMSAISPMPI